MAPAVLPAAALPTPARSAPALAHAPPFRADPRHVPQLHAALIKSGELAASPKSLHSLLEAAAQADSPAHLTYAIRLFRLGPRPPSSAPCYNVLMCAFFHAGRPDDALHLFVEMLDAGSACPDQHTVACVLKSCARMCTMDVGCSVHAYAIKLGLIVDRFVLSSMVHMYASCGDVVAAGLLLDAVEEKGFIIWNAIIAGYLKNGDWKEVVDMFRRMREVGVTFDEVTLVSVATACGRVGDAKLGKWIAGYVDEKATTRNQNLVRTW